MYVAGNSTATWGLPVRPYTGFDDAYVARLDSGGVLTWNTFLGGSGSDIAWGIAVDGAATCMWPDVAMLLGIACCLSYTAGNDAFVARVNSSGTLYLEYLSRRERMGR